MRAAAELLARSPASSGLCCDFDGTIAEIVLDPGRASPLPGALDALHVLAGQLAVAAVVSGRPGRFLAERLRLAAYRSPLRAIGLHGLEEAHADGTIEARPGVAEWRPMLELARDRLIESVPEGARVEDKGYGITVHWRSVVEAPRTVAALAGQATAVIDAIAADLGLVPKPGKSIVELVPPLGIDKGSVVRELCGDLGQAAYVGDDAGDLVAFTALDELARRTGLRALKVAVAGPELPAALGAAADLVLDGPRATVAFLAAIAGLRPS